jgi:segregation and condensation protein A
LSVSHRVPITIRLDHFEGPLDLLLYLIQSHELDISKLAISQITDQYLSYVQLMQELNFDVASDFLVMAATLIHWKSKAILPQEGTAADAALQGEDAVLTPEQLLRQLLEHQRFLKAGETLSHLNLLGEDVFSRPNSKPPTEKLWKEMSITALALTYQDLLVKSRKRKTILKKETVSITDKIGTFTKRLKIGSRSTMRALIDDIQNRPEVVVTFLASLELSRLKKMRLYQEGTYQDIYLELLESLSNFNPGLATGFDSFTDVIEESIVHDHAVADADAAVHAAEENLNLTTEAGTLEEVAAARANLEEAQFRQLEALEIPDPRPLQSRNLDQSPVDNATSFLDQMPGLERENGSTTSESSTESH